MPAQSVPSLQSFTQLLQEPFFPPRCKFIGIDVCLDGIHLEKSKHRLLETLLVPEIVHDVAKFIGFCQFYSRFIPNFEIHVLPLQGVTKQQYTDAVGPFWMPKAKGAWDDLKGAILSDPCIQRFDHLKLIVLWMDFSSLGFGFVLLQPGYDKASTKAAQDYWDGCSFSFMTKDSIAALHPVFFGTRQTQGNELQLHSHLGEGFSGDYTINKCRQYIFGQRFVWVTDCYAITFILSYESGNPAILRLQMHLMCWDVDIVHWPDTELIDAYYWLPLGVDLYFDPLF
jgi:hypothetical protein